MKALMILALLTLSSQAFSETITCHADHAFQSGAANMKADGVIEFQLNRETKEMTNVIGHIFVQNPYAEADEDISIENSYMGFFHIESIEHNADYRPIRYKGFTQYKNFEALHTAGSESGMWGAFVINLSTPTATEARYVFQAGDHMGGTLIMKCRSHSR